IGVGFGLGGGDETDGFGSVLRRWVDAFHRIFAAQYVAVGVGHRLRNRCFGHAGSLLCASAAALYSPISTLIGSSPPVSSPRPRIACSSAIRWGGPIKACSTCRSALALTVTVSMSISLSSGAALG